MNNNSKKFLFRTLLLSIVLIVFYILSEYILNLNILPVIFPYLLIVFLFIYNISFYLLNKVAGKEFRKFLNINMLMTFIKLIIMMGMVLAYLFFWGAEIIRFIISFFVLYLLFTSLEVGSIVPEVRKKQQSS